MEMPDVDKKIKTALLMKANEIEPSEEAFSRIIEGLENKQTRRFFLNKGLNRGYRYYIITLFFIVSVIFAATTIALVDGNTSAREISRAIVVDNTKLDNLDPAERAESIFYLQAFTSCFLLAHLDELELYLRLLIFGKMTSKQSWGNVTAAFDKFHYVGQEAGL